MVSPLVDKKFNSTLHPLNLFFFLNTFFTMPIEKKPLVLQNPVPFNAFKFSIIKLRITWILFVLVYIELISRAQNLVSLYNHCLLIIRARQPRDSRL